MASDFRYDAGCFGSLLGVRPPEVAMSRFVASIGAKVLVPVALVLLVAGGLVYSAGKAPCSLLTQAEIQEAIGKPVEAGKPNGVVNAAAGSSCDYRIPPYGTFSLLVKPLGAGETPDRILAAFQKRKAKVTVVPGLGDQSFFLNPGYGMIQLNSFKAGSYLLITMMVPGSTEDAGRAIAVQLMKKVLARL